MRRLIIVAVLTLLAVVAVAWSGPGDASRPTSIRSNRVTPSGQPPPLEPEQASAVADAWATNIYLTAAYDRDTFLSVEGYLTALSRVPPQLPQAPVYAATTPRPAVSSWPTSLYPCGGDLPPCYVKMRESGGDYNARNPTSSASGAWQFLTSTFANAVTEAGYPQYAGQPAYLAPPAVQDAAARALWAGGAGCSAWSAC